MSGPHVRVAIEGGLARLTLDRPPLNVLTTAMMEELASALSVVASRDDVRVVRLDAAGKHFCAGVDVADHEGDRLAPMMRALAALFLAFEEAPQPVVAVVQGVCLGGGLELVLACDRDLHFDRARLNVNGGAIALGHPIGCTGARIVTTLLHEMERRNARLGLATLCVSGGLGLALELDRNGI